MLSMIGKDTVSKINDVKVDIANNADGISSANSKISDNTKKISNNTNNIATNTKDISSNADTIATNTDEINVSENMQTLLFLAFWAIFFNPIPHRLWEIRYHMGGGYIVHALIFTL